MSYRTTEGSKFKVSTQEIGTRDLFSVKTLAGVRLSSYAYTDSIGSTDGIISFNFSKGFIFFLVAISFGRVVVPSPQNSYKPSRDL